MIKNDHLTKMMIETSNKAKKLVSYKMVEEKLILSIKSNLQFTQCLLKYGKNSRLHSPLHILILKGLANGSLPVLSIGESTAGRT